MPPPRFRFYEPSCDKPQIREDAELCAERKSADAEDKSAHWALAQFWVSVVGIAAVIGTLAFTKRAADAAWSAAVAAAKSADIAPVIEQAYVYPVVTAVGPMNDIIERARVFYLDNASKGDTPANETAEISFSLKNFGKTPAVIRNVFASFGVVPMGTKNGVSLPEAILGAGEETSTVTVPMDQGITPNQARKILTYTGTLGFDGLILFEDIWGAEHKTNFLFKWDKEIEKMVLEDIVTAKVKNT